MKRKNVISAMLATSTTKFAERPKFWFRYNQTNPAEYCLRLTDTEAKPASGVVVRYVSDIADDPFLEVRLLVSDFIFELRLCLRSLYDHLLVVSEYSEFPTFKSGSGLTLDDIRWALQERLIERNPHYIGLLNHVRFLVNEDCSLPNVSVTIDPEIDVGRKFNNVVLIALSIGK